MPGFAPANEILLFRQKDPKPLMPHPATLNKAAARHGVRPNSLRSHKGRNFLRAPTVEAGRQATASLEEK